MEQQEHEHRGGSSDPIYNLLPSIWSCLFGVATGWTALGQNSHAAAAVVAATQKWTRSPSYEQRACVSPCVASSITVPYNPASFFIGNQEAFTATELFNDLSVQTYPPNYPLIKEWTYGVRVASRRHPMGYSPLYSNQPSAAHKIGEHKFN